MIAFKAEILDNTKEVEGYLKKCTDTGDVLWIQTEQWIDYQIKPETIKVSFDDGETWNTFSKVKECIKYCDSFRMDLGAAL